MRQKIVGVLALQGAVAEHLSQLEQAGVRAIAVKNCQQLEQLDGLVIPGGESTAIGRLMRLYGFIAAIQQFARAGKPILGTCAGMILLAKRLHNDAQRYLQLVDITLQRNAFGRQINSFETTLEVKNIAQPVPAVFIRAPYVVSVDSAEVEILAKVDEHPVLVKQANIIACSFHPELTPDLAIVELLIKLL